MCNPVFLYIQNFSIKVKNVVMLRIIFAIIVLVHGLIHLMGFANQWHIKKFSQFTGITLFPVSENLSKIFGIFWLLAALLFIVSAVGFVIDKDWWRILGFASVIISQLLIIIYWKDAWAGTIPNVIILFIAIISCSISEFNNKTNEETVQLFSNVKGSYNVITKEMVQELPPVVQKWIKRSGIIGKENINTVRLKQKAQMKSKPDGDWMDVNAVQYFRTDEPGFIYNIDVDAFPMISMVGRDKYENGTGNMLIKISGLYTLADASCEEIDQGTMIRYLSETFWFPSFAFSKYVKWEQIDDNKAKATMTYKGKEEHIIVTFTPEGDVKKIEAERYGEFEGKYSKELWSVVNTSFKEFNGIRIANTSEVTWKLKSGDFTWFKLEITELEYNKPFIY